MHLAQIILNSFGIVTKYSDVLIVGQNILHYTSIFCKECYISKIVRLYNLINVSEQLAKILKFLEELIWDCRNVAVQKCLNQKRTQTTHKQI